MHVINAGYLKMKSNYEKIYYEYIFNLVSIPNDVSLEIDWMVNASLYAN